MGHGSPSGNGGRFHHGLEMRIFIGWDSREEAAFDVARDSAEQFGHEVIPLRAEVLRSSGLLTRPTDSRGQLFDLHSGKPQSTEFNLTRFFVPMLAHSGFCLYVDCDVIFLRDPAQLRQTAPVSVVKHALPQLASVKMDGATQRIYPRKLWSSVMLFNCDHPANRRLNLSMLNNWDRDDLHALRWLADSEIGTLPAEANWLVGVQPKPKNAIIAHYTLGTPDMKGHENDEYADLWLERVSQR